MGTEQIEWSLTSKDYKETVKKDDGNHWTDIFNKRTGWVKSKRMLTFQWHINVNRF